MANKPVLFAVDDDPEVLRAVERDLRRKYGRSRNGGGYRILRADSAGRGWASTSSGVSSRGTEARSG